MKIFDISVPITNGMLTWPGDPPVELTKIGEIANGDESNISYLQLCVHTGTHIDAPKHFIDEGKTTELIELEKLIGEALVVHINRDIDLITGDVLRNHPRNADLKKSKRILFHTRNSEYWTSQPNVFCETYVGINDTGARYLIDLGIDLVGIDYLSIAPFTDTEIPHQLLLSNEVVILEGLNLANVKEGFYKLTCLPLKIPYCDGAPARAILTQIPEN